jgi:hypothetical protein
MKRIITVLCSLLVVCSANSGELVHQFFSPAFNGSGYSTHMLTIKQLGDQATSNLKAEAAAIKSAAEAAAANTPQAQFIASFQARVYSQLAQQLTNSLFGASGAPTCSAATAGQICGHIPDLAGNNVSWRLGVGSDTGMIILTITNNTNVNQTTTMKIPSGTFTF